jgi:MerR family redox-sensitive transcriptional activator SoxR
VQIQTARETDLQIGEIARLAGLRPSTLRYYERLGLLPEPERVNGRRRYDPDVLDLLAAIEVSKRAGFSLAEIAALFSFAPSVSPSERWQRLAQGKLEEIEALIARAEAMREVLRRGLECGCLRLQDCELFNDPQLTGRPADGATRARAATP